MVKVDRSAQSDSGSVISLGLVTLYVILLSLSGCGSDAGNGGANNSSPDNSSPDNRSPDNSSPDSSSTANGVGKESAKTPKSAEKAKKIADRSKAEQAKKVGQDSEQATSQQPVTKSEQLTESATADGPWTPVLSQTDLPDFDDICFRTRPISPLREGDEKKWLKPIDGHPLKLTRNEKGVVLDGTASIESPWPSDGCLRLHVEQFDSLSLSFSSQTHEATISFEQQTAICQAYLTPLQDGARQPHRWFFSFASSAWQRLASRASRPIDIHFRHNHLWLTCGELVVTKIPFQGAPKSAQMQGKLTLAAIELLRFNPLPELQPNNSEHAIPSPRATTPTNRKWELTTHSFSTVSFRIVADQLSCSVQTGDENRPLFTSKRTNSGSEISLPDQTIDKLLLPQSATHCQIAFGVSHAVVSFSQSERRWTPVARFRLAAASERKLILQQQDDNPPTTPQQFSCPLIFTERSRDSKNEVEPDIGKLWQDSQALKADARKSALGPIANLLWRAKTEEQVSKAIRLLVFAYFQQEGPAGIPHLLSLGRYTSEQATQALLESIARSAYSYSIDNDWRAFTEIHRQILHAEIDQLQSVISVDPLASLAWSELLQSIYGNKSAQAVELLSRLRFFYFDSRLKWFPSAIARTRIDAVDKQSELFQSQSRWTELWREELNREAYNAISEIAALRETDSLVGVLDALLAEHVSLDGLGASPVDKRVFLSVPTAAYWLHESTPELTTLTRKTKQDLATQIIPAAQQRKDFRRASYLATVLRGTRAASSFYRDAGDRAISHGLAKLAAWQYSQASKSAIPSHERDLQARIAMLRTMQGSSAKYNVEEIHARVADHADGPLGTKEDLPNDVFQTMQHDAELEFGTVKSSAKASDMQNGLESGGQYVRVLSRAKVDWWQNQFNVTASGELVLYHNRYELRALKRKEGEVAWRATISGKPRMSAVDWINTSSRPLRLHDAILSRFYYGSSPMLVSHRASDGKQLTQNVFVNEHLVSDPFLVKQRLFGIIARPTRQNQIVSILLAEFDPETCKPISYKQLLELDGAWWSRKHCQVTSIADGFIVALGGVVLFADESGRLHWVRKRDNWLTGDLLSELQQRHVRPIVHNDRVLVAEVGDWHLTCLDLRTGSRIWRRLYPQLQRVHYSKHGAIVIERGNVHLVDLDVGKTIWTRQLNMRITTSLLAKESLVVGGMVNQTAGFSAPQLVSFAVANGAQQKQIDIPASRSSNGTLGPIVGYFESNNGVYYGANQSKPDRTFLRFQE